jgi:hypothetical protein
MIPQNVVTAESEREMQGVRALAEALEVRFDEIVRSGSQGTVIGIQSKSVLFSQRLDSRTVFVQDARYGPGLEAGVYDGSDDDFIRASKAIVDKLGIPSQEIADSKVRREQTQQAEFDEKTGQWRFEDRRPGKAMLRLTRRIEDLPVWSSGITLGLTKSGGIGFLEAHWPEVPSTVLEEARRLAERLKEGWRPPERQGGKPESIEAGIIHSPATGFIMDIYPAIRVIYTDISMGKKATLYLDRHGNNVPIPRQFDKPPDRSPGPRGEP